jgi:hypothetical protein
MIFLAFIFCTGLSITALAQTSVKKNSKQQTMKSKSTAGKGAKKATPRNKAGESVSFTATSSHAAYGRAGRRFSIADPTINVLNQRANGSNVPVSSSGIVGMPKGTYGFANGKILLRPTTATSSGTVYGSGAVGTGTTIMGVGTGENTTGINGKNPYAGHSLWGTRLPVQQIPSDTIKKQ